MHLPSSITTFHCLLPLFLIILLTCLCHSHSQEINLVQQRQLLKILKRKVGHHQYLLCIANADWEICHYYPNQEDINDLIREMALTKSNDELLISRLKLKDLLDDSVCITFQKKRRPGFSTFFSFGMVFATAMI